MARRWRASTRPATLPPHGDLMKQLLAGIVAVVALSWSPHVGAQADRAKLEVAFVEVDRLFTQFANEQHVPGAAWGVIVNGELAHAAATGVRDVTSKALV